MKAPYQRGSAHVVIIGALVIALLGIVGYVFYQNFVAKRETTKRVDVSQTVSTPTTPNASYSKKPTVLQ